MFLNISQSYFFISLKYSREQLQQVIAVGLTLTFATVAFTFRREKGNFVKNQLLWFLILRVCFIKWKLTPRIQMPWDLMVAEWWSEQLIEYWMEVHLFGSTSSPSCVNFCIRKTAQDNIGNFSREVMNTILKNFYVDDCLKSVQSSCAAINLRSHICKLLQKGEFWLTKWSCNSKDVLETIPKADRAPWILDLDLNA